MAFCQAYQENIGASNYNDDFATKTSQKSVLPNSGTGFTFTNGAADPTTVKNWITGTLLPQEGVILPQVPASDPNQAGTFATKANALRAKVEKEYCFYYIRYTYALTTLLGQAASGVNLASNPPADYVTLKNNTIALNKKLNSIIEVLNGLTIVGTEKLGSYYGANGGLNSLNDSLSKTKAELNRSAQMLEKNEFETEAKKAMIDYTLEKNDSSRNMLGLYVFLNFVAGGLLYYLYRNSP